MRSTTAVVAYCTSASDQSGILHEIFGRDAQKKKRNSEHTTPLRGPPHSRVCRRPHYHSLLTELAILQAAASPLFHGDFVLKETRGEPILLMAAYMVFSWLNSTSSFKGWGREKVRRMRCLACLLVEEQSTRDREPMRGNTLTPAANDGPITLP